METFPTEILYHIFAFLPVLDIVRLRRVCSSFKKASQDRYVWSTVYRHCRLPRLPGPFPRQTARHLEDSLIRSAELQKIWASSPQAIMKPLYIRALHFPSSNDIRGTLFFGPWLVVAGQKKILCYNVESGSNNGTIVYEAPLYQIYAFSGVGILDSGEQHGAYLVVQEKTAGSHRILKIFQLLVPDHPSDNAFTLEPLSELQVDFIHRFAVAVGPRCFAAAPIYLQDNYTDVYVMDTKRRRRLYLAAHSDSINQPTLSHLAFSTLVVCSSHVLVFKVVPRGIFHCLSIVNAFYLPIDGEIEDGSPTLQMTHSGSFLDIGFMDVTCLHDAVVDETTGSTLLTLICHARAPIYQTSRTLDIVQLELTPDGRILMPECRTIVQLDFGFAIHLQCFQGCGRGLLEGFPSSRARFAISVDDANQDAPITISNIETSYEAPVLGFDGIYGRICQRSSSREVGMELQVVSFV